MLLVDGQGVPVACRTASASPAEITLVEDLTAQVTVSGGEVPLVADRADDSDPHRQRLKARGFDLVCPHRKGRKRRPTQDGRKLRRYKRRWKVERTISWLGNCRRLLVRHEYHVHMFQGFITLACLMLCLKRF
ncbi:MAG: transposase [Parvibaculum sp.]|nr:transposase [Parvibaculum sp.]